MRPRSHPRRGMSTLAVIIAVMVVSLIAGGTWSATSLQVLGEVRRSQAGQRTLEFARSAMAEILFAIQIAANDPTDPVGAWFRTLDPASVGRDLPVPTLHHLATHVDAPRIRHDARVTLEDYAVDPWDQAAAGLLRFTVEATGSEGVRRQIDQTRAFRIQRVVPPSPLHRWLLAPDPGPTLETFQVPATRVHDDPRTDLRAAWTSWQGHPEDPYQVFVPTPGGADVGEAWRSRAAWEVEEDLTEPGTSLAGFLSRRLSSPDSRLNGIVLVDTAGWCRSRPGCLSPPVQELRDLTFRGQALLVVTGPVEIENVTLGNPQEDLLTLVTYQHVRFSRPSTGLTNRIEANIIVCPSPDGTRYPSLGTDIEMSGSFLDLSTTPGSLLTGTLSPHPRFGPSGTGPRVVLLSPLSRWKSVDRG